MTSIKIGYSLSLSGAYEAYGQSALMAHQIWQEDVNKKGGILGRRVELHCIDDQSNPNLVAGIYRTLIEEEKVDLLLGGYGSTLVNPAMNVALEYNKFFLSLSGKGASEKNSFSIIPCGNKPNTSLTENFFKGLQKNSSVAIVSADADFSKNIILGARENALKNSQRIIFEYNYPLTTFDFSTLAVELWDLKPDAVLINAYSSDAMGLIKSINDLHFHPKKMAASVILPPGLRNVCSGVEEVMEKYLSRTHSIEADILGYFIVPEAYAQLQVIEQAIIATGGIVDEKLAGHTCEAVFRTVLGDLRFDKNGECSVPQMLQVQFHHTHTHDDEQTTI